MRVPSRTMSRPSHIVCPACGSGEFQPRGSEPARCDSCGFTVEDAVFRTLEQIAALPDALGTHPCEECGHPEMRLLPDGVFHCPACGSEVLPIEAASGLENARVGSASARGRRVAPHPGTRPRRQEARGGEKQEEGAREGSKHQGGVLR